MVSKGVDTKRCCPITGDQPESATTGSTLMPIVSPGITGMRGTFSPVLASAIKLCAQSPGSRAGESKAQQIASWNLVVVPAKTDTPGAGFSHAVNVNAVAAAIITIEAIRRPLRTGDDGEGMVGHYPDAVPASG